MSARTASHSTDAAKETFAASAQHQAGAPVRAAAAATAGTRRSRGATDWPVADARRWCSHHELLAEELLDHPCGSRRCSASSIRGATSLNSSTAWYSSMPSNCGRKNP